MQVFSSVFIFLVIICHILSIFLHILYQKQENLFKPRLKRREDNKMKFNKETIKCFSGYNGIVTREDSVIFGIPTEEQINELYDAAEAYNQIDFEEYLAIPKVKPDVEQIQSMHVKVCLKDAWVSPSGFKIFIKGVLWQKITYTAGRKDQPVHTVEKDIPFSHFIDLRQFNLDPVPPNCDLFKAVTLAPEDAFVQIKNSRSIFKDVIITAFFDEDKCC